MSKKNLTDNAYRMTMLDLSHDPNGTAMTEAKMNLQALEKEERYEECAGVLRAMETYGFIRNFYLVTEKNNLSDKIQLDYDNGDNTES